MAASKSFIPPSSTSKKTLNDNKEDSISRRSEQIASGLVERIFTIDPNKIEPNPYQPRKHFDEESIRELAEDILRDGQIQPVVVIDTGSRYVLVVGERRTRACKLINVDVKAIIEKGTEESLQKDSTRLLRVAMMENIKREDLTIIERAESLQKLSESPDYLGIPRTVFAKKIAIPYSTVNRLFDILKLPDAIKDRIRADNSVSIRALENLSRMEEGRAIELFEKIVNEQLNSTDSLDLIAEAKKEKGEPRKTGGLSYIHQWGSFKDSDKKLTIQVDKNKANPQMIAEIQEVLKRYDAAEE